MQALPNVRVRIDRAVVGVPRMNRLLPRLRAKVQIIRLIVLLSATTKCATLGLATATGPFRLTRLI